MGLRPWEEDAGERDRADFLLRMSLLFFFFWLLSDELLTVKAVVGPDEIIGRFAF